MRSANTVTKQFYIANDTTNETFYQFAGKEFYWGQNGKALQFKNDAFYPNADESIDLGTGSFKFNDVFAKNATISTSDFREKSEISYFEHMKPSAFNEYQQFCELVQPVLYKWKSGGKRQHAGFVAQDILNACIVSGLNPDDMAFFVKSDVWDDIQILDESGLPKTNKRYVEESVVNEDGKRIVEKRLVGETPITESIQRLNEDGTPYEKLGLRMNELMTVLYAVQDVKQSRLEARVAALEA